MQGRYGNDNLNRFLMALALILLVLSMFRVPYVYMLAILLIVYAYFRMFSRNTYKRSMENNKYMQLTYKVKQRFARIKWRIRQSKTHHIYKCPSCKQKIRIPRGKGKIEVRCPKCGHIFVKRS